jgi:hypothetical protein
MRKHISYGAIIAAMFIVTIPGRSEAQYLLATDKKIYEPNDSISFGYIFPKEHDWVTLWLFVVPIGKGNNLTTAVSLDNTTSGSKTYHASRFGPGKYKASLTGTNQDVKNQFIEVEFEITKERKKYQVGTIDLQDDEQKERVSTLKRLVKEKSPPYNDAVKKYNAVAGRLALLQEQMDKLDKEKSRLTKKIGRTSKKIGDYENRTARILAIRKLFNDGLVNSDQVRKITSERDSLQKIISDSEGDVRAARVELPAAIKALQLTETKLKNLRARPLILITEEMETAKETLKNASDELHEVEIKYYENRSVSSVEEVKILSGGKTIYQATWNWTADQMLRKLMNDLKEDSAKAAAVKNKAYHNFYAACLKELAAGQKLGGSTGEIMKAAYKNAAIESVFNAIDLGVAYADGGFFGLLYEAGKKLAMTYGKEKLFPSELIEPGSIEAEFFREYEIRNDIPFQSDYELTADANRILENQKISDWLTTGGKAVGQLSYPWILDKLLARDKEIKKITDIDKVVEEMLAFGENTEKVLGVGKDILQDALGAWAKSNEQKAWMDYILAARKARMLFAPYALAAKHYWKVDSMYHEVLATYASFVNSGEFESKEPFKVTINNQFYEDDDLQMMIKTKAENGGYKDRIVLGGFEAFYQSPHKFGQKVSDNLNEESKGKVKLNVFVFKNPMNGWNPLSYQAGQ